MPIVIEAVLDSSGVTQGVDRAKRSLNSLESETSKLERSFGSLASAAKAAIGMFVADQLANFVSNVTRASDEITNLKSRLDLVGGSFQEVYKVAQETGTSLTSVGESYVRLANATKDLGASQQEVVRMTETLSKLLVVSGASTSEASAAMLQFSQAMASGTLQGDEFRSLAENLPMLLDYLADTLGVTRGELKQLASEGKITSEVMRNALAKAAEDVDVKFTQMGDNFGRTTQKLINFITAAAQEFMNFTNAAKIYDAAVESIISFSEGAVVALKSIPIALKEIWEYMKFYAKSLGDWFDSIGLKTGAFFELVQDALSGNWAGALDRFKAKIVEADKIFSRASKNRLNEFGKVKVELGKQYESLTKGLKTVDQAVSEVSSTTTKTGKNFVSTAKSAASATKEVTKSQQEASKAVGETAQSAEKLSRAQAELNRIYEATTLDTYEGKLEKINRHYDSMKERLIDIAFQLNMDLETFMEFYERIEAKQQESINNLSKTANTASGIIKNTVSEAKTSVADLGNAIASIITNPQGALQSFMGSFGGGFNQILGGIFSGNFSFGGGPIGTIFQGLGSLTSQGGGGLTGMLGGLMSMFSGGLSNYGNALMYMIPETLLDWGFTDLAFGLGSMPTSLMGGITAGLGALLEGFFTGDWGAAATKGIFSGLGAAAGSIFGPVGTGLGSLLGGFIGDIVGGLFGDGTERTYLVRDYTLSYGAGGASVSDPRTVRWDRGEPDYMDTLVDWTDQMMASFVDTLDALFQGLDRFLPGYSERWYGTEWGYRAGWGAETDEEVQEDLEHNVKVFGRDVIQPIIDDFKAVYSGRIEGMDLSMFTDEKIAELEEKFSTIFDDIDFTNIESIEEFQREFEELDRAIAEIEFTASIVDQVNELKRQLEEGADATSYYHDALVDFNAEWIDQAYQLMEVGVDMEKLPEYAQLWAQALEDMKRSMMGWLVDIPEYVNEQWAQIARSFANEDFAGMLVQLFNEAVVTGDWSSVGHDWAMQINEVFKEYVMTTALNQSVQQIMDAYMTDLFQVLLDDAFDVTSIQGAFEGMWALTDDLEGAGQSLAEVFQHIQTEGSLAGFNWDEWNAKWGSTWEEINAKNEELHQKQVDQAEYMMDALIKLKEAGELNITSANDLKLAAQRLTDSAQQLTASAASVSKISYE